MNCHEKVKLSEKRAWLNKNGDIYCRNRQEFDAKNVVFLQSLNLKVVSCQKEMFGPQMIKGSGSRSPVTHVLAWFYEAKPLNLRSYLHIHGLHSSPMNELIFKKDSMRYSRGSVYDILLHFAE